MGIHIYILYRRHRVTENYIFSQPIHVELIARQHYIIANGQYKQWSTQTRQRTIRASSLARLGHCLVIINCKMLTLMYTKKHRK